ncbi:MAG: CheA signal transduction histidine kinase [uncultured bacterium]|nr:MAG: CheA signal transduction histidine kinase [uncultured bacterium]
MRLLLVIIDAFIVRVGDQRFAIPQSTVSEVMELPESQITTLQSGEIFSCRGEPLPIARLATIFHQRGDPEATGTSHKTKLALITGENGSRTALVVDRVLGTREVVVRAVIDPLVAQPGIAGATELGDGSIVLILDVRNLLHRERTKGPDSTQREDHYL